MTGSQPTENADLAALADAVRAAAATAGLARVGITSADPFVDTRAYLEERKRAGLHGGMHFTYGDPERSTDPQRALPGAAALVVGARSYLRTTEETADADDAGDPTTPLGRVARYSWHDHYT